ncbi:hypothetical protein [Prosthecobacter sp.]|uniref:hypothetical protein n=1 Tax=Prosthecobacter sp. TaxID=1965333 RepID=UPI0037837BB4
MEPAKWLADSKFLLFLALTNEWVKKQDATKKLLLPSDFFPNHEPTAQQLVRSRIAGEDDSGVGFRANKSLRDHLAELRRELSGIEVRQDVTARRQTLETLATTLETVHVWEQASVTLEQLATLNEKLKDTVGHVNALIRSGTARYRAEQYLHAMPLLEKALEIIQTDSRLGLSRSRIKAMDYIALIHLRSGRPGDALALFTGPNRAERRTFPTPPLMWAALANRMGLCHLELGNFNRAHRLLCAAHRLRSKHGAKTEEARTIANLALISFRQGMAGEVLWFKRAYVMFMLALRCQEAAKDVTGQVRTQFYLGHCCRFLDEQLNKSNLSSEYENITFDIDALLFPNRYVRNFLTLLSGVHFGSGTTPVKRIELRRRAAYHYEQSLTLGAGGIGDASVAMEAKRVLDKLRGVQELDGGVQKSTTEQ